MEIVLSELLRMRQRRETPRRILYDDLSICPGFKHIRKSFALSTIEIALLPYNMLSSETACNGCRFDV